MRRQEKQSTRAGRRGLPWLLCRRIGVTLFFVAPAALAWATVGSQLSDPAIELTAGLRADTGVSKMRSGKTVIRAAMPQLATDRKSLQLSLDGFRVEGDPRLVPEALNDILAPWRGKSLTFVEYEQALHAVADYLRANGHPNAQVRMSRALAGGGAVIVAIDGLADNQPLVAAAEVAPQIEVKRFKLTGLTLAPESDVQAVLSDLSGRLLTAAEMETAAKKVADYLRAKGYPFVQAYLPPQRVDTGEVEISIQEGRLDATLGRDGVSVDNEGQRVKTSVIEEFLLRGVKAGGALRMVDLERAVLLASDLPGIKNITTEIVPGTQPGTTHLKARVEDASVFAGNVITDNYGSRYTGEARVLAQLQLNSPLGYGEQFNATVVKSSLMNSSRWGVLAPVGSSGLKLGASYSTLRSRIGLDLAILNLNSQADIGSVFASYPLVRSAENNVNLSWSYDKKRFVTDLNWGRENDRNINLTTLGASGDVIDSWGGQTRWATGLGVGRNDLSANALYADTDARTAQTQGGFRKFNWQASRYAALTANGLWTWQLAASGQEASKNLDSSEKFQLGGPTGVRAYPVGEGLGDKGWLANLELRYRLPTFAGVSSQLIGFYDLGRVSQYANPWQSTPNNSFTLQGYGGGTSLAIGTKGEIKLMVARRIGVNPNASAIGNDADGRKTGTRLWILGSIIF